MNLNNVASILADTGMTWSQKGIASGKVILTGFVVVFAVLLLLIMIIKIYSAVVQKIQNKGKKKKKDIKVDENNTPVQPAVSVASTTAKKAEDGISDEVVAVISAAVATMYGSSEKAKIKSIKKSNSGRSAWANAGILDNTRPF